MNPAAVEENKIMVIMGSWFGYPCGNLVAVIEILEYN
jgi:hypothetical protein